MSRLEEMHAELLERLIEQSTVIRHLSNELGSAAQFFRSPPPNAVFMSETVTLDVNGQYSHDWPEPFAAVAIINLSGAQITVSGDGLQQSAPVSGSGVFVVPAKGFAVHNLLSRSISLYGLAGAQLDVVIYERPQDAGFGVTNALTSPPVTFADGVQTAVSNAAVPIVAANPNRSGVMVTNVGANPVRIGLAGVTAATGFARLATGQEVTLPTVQALFSIREGAADSTVLVAEVT